MSVVGGNHDSTVRRVGVEICQDLGSDTDPAIHRGFDPALSQLLRPLLVQVIAVSDAAFFSVELQLVTWNIGILRKGQWVRFALPASHDTATGGQSSVMVSDPMRHTHASITMRTCPRCRSPRDSDPSCNTR